MKVYLFRDPEDKTTLEFFLKDATTRSLKALRVFALAAAFWCTLVIIASVFLPENLVVNNQEEFLLNQVAGLMNSLLFLLMYQVVKRRRLRGQWAGARLLVTAYSLVIVTHFLVASFLAQYNPGNTMTFFLLGCIFIVIIVLLRTREILFITCGVYLLLLLMMPVFQEDPQKVGQTYITGFITLLMTFLMSRIWFSTQYNQFLQLRTIAKKNEEINKINILQTDMLAIVAHDLRTPVNNIAAAIEFLREGNVTPQETEQFYRMIQTSCREADHFIHDLIDVARNQDNLPLQTSSVNLSMLIQDTADAWRRLAGSGKQITVIDPPQPVAAEIHEQKVLRVLNNLVHNAVKFTADDGIIKLMLNANEEMIHIAVSDNGIGIPEALLPDIFERFTKAGRQGLKGEKSYGLGLSICRQIVAQHHGSIRVESADKQGTTFHIILPRSAAGATRLPAHAAGDAAILYASS